MFTLLILIIVVLVISTTYIRHKQEQIVNLSQKELLEKHRHACAIYRGWLIFAVLLFVGGYLLSVCYPMYETEEYEYWLFGTQKGTREVLTTSAWWSYILRTLGVLIGIPVSIGFFDRWNAIKRYKKMSLHEFSNLQYTTQQNIDEQDQETKKVKKVNLILKILGKIISAG